MTFSNIPDFKILLPAQSKAKTSTIILRVPATFSLRKNCFIIYVYSVIGLGTFL